MWYRVRTQHDDKRVGQIFEAEGTLRNLMLVQAGYLVEMPEVLRSLPTGPVVKIPIKANPAFTEPPRGTTRPTKRRRRGEPAETESTDREDVRQEPGDAARGEDGTADRDGGETSGSGAQGGSAA